MAETDKDKKTKKRKKTTAKKTSKSGSKASKGTKKSTSSKTSKSAAKKSSGKKSASSSSRKTTSKKTSGTSSKKTSGAKKTSSGKKASARTSAPKTSRDKTQAKSSSSKKKAPAASAAAPKKSAAAVKKAPRKKSKRVGLKVVALLSVLICYTGLMLFGAHYVNETIVKPEKFPQGTVINNVDVSGLTPKKAKARLSRSWNKHSLSILEYGGSSIGEIDGFDLKYDIDDSLEKVLRPGAVKSLTRFIKGEKTDVSITMTPKGPTKKFKSDFNKLPIAKDAEGSRKSHNAYIDMSNTDFQIVKEVYGDSVDHKKVQEAMLESIAAGEKTFEYKRSSYYKTPEITSRSESLLKKRDYCKKYLTFKIDYVSPVNKYRITPGWLDRMIKVQDNGEVILNSGQVNKFVTEVVSPKFSSTGATRRLKSCGGGRYTVTGGTYGYTIDVAKEKKKLKGELRSMKNVERSPIYAGKTPKPGQKNDIGDDFVEISIGKQMVWVVRKGKVKVKSPVVTGNIYDGHATPTGTYYIVYKDTNTVLRGRNNDGSEYESHVAYWAPFYLGYGLHDASWRGAFGGTIYRGGGSHGCVNCPVPVMPKIFKNIYPGMPVIVH